MLCVFCIFLLRCFIYHLDLVNLSKILVFVMVVIKNPSTHAILEFGCKRKLSHKMSHDAQSFLTLLKSVADTTK